MVSISDSKRVEFYLRCEIQERCPIPHFSNERIVVYNCKTPSVKISNGKNDWLPEGKDFSIVSLEDTAQKTKIDKKTLAELVKIDVINPPYDDEKFLVGIREEGTITRKVLSVIDIVVKIDGEYFSYESVKKNISFTKK